jgi:hypothetical protein
MRRLKHHQRVEIHLDEEDQAVVCRVASVQGGVATLTRVDELPPELLGRFIPGAFGYLLFDHRGSPTALKGIAAASGTDDAELAFVVIDGVQLPERRAAERVDLPARARIWAPGGANDGEGIEATAANVSAGGVLIERPAGLADGRRFVLELLLAEDPAPIRCEAVIVRETLTHLAMKFTDIQDADRVRLARMIRRQALGVA